MEGEGRDRRPGRQLRRGRQSGSASMRPTTRSGTPTPTTATRPTKALIFSLNGNWMENNLLARPQLTLADKKNISGTTSVRRSPSATRTIRRTSRRSGGPSRGTEDYRIVVSSIIHLPWGLGLRRRSTSTGRADPLDAPPRFPRPDGNKEELRPSGRVRARQGERTAVPAGLSLRLTKAFPLSGYGTDLSVIARGLLRSDRRDKLSVNSIDAAKFSLERGGGEPELREISRHASGPEEIELRAAFRTLVFERGFPAAAIVLKGVPIRAPPSRGDDLPFIMSQQVVIITGAAARHRKSHRSSFCPGRGSQSPAWAKRRAVAFPMPAAAPVMMTTRWLMMNGPRSPAGRYPDGHPPRHNGTVGKPRSKTRIRNAARLNLCRARSVARYFPKFGFSTPALRYSAASMELTS